MNSLCILDINPLSDTFQILTSYLILTPYLIKISHLVGCLFILLMVSFAMETFLRLI